LGMWAFALIFELSMSHFVPSGVKWIGHGKNCRAKVLIESFRVQRATDSELERTMGLRLFN